MADGRAKSVYRRRAKASSRHGTRGRSQLPSASRRHTANRSTRFGACEGADQYSKVSGRALSRQQQEIFRPVGMRLYSGMSPEFLQDTVRNQIADKLSNAFFNYY